jgi:hypothetical protein
VYEGLKMIQPAALSGYLPVSQIYSARFSPGKLEIPVEANQVIYANFEHVVGIPSAQPGTGISIDRLMVLDTLINQLESAQKTKIERPEAAKTMSDQGLDSLIEEYAKKLSSATKSAQDNKTSAQPYRPSRTALTGIILNIIA